MKRNELEESDFREKKQELLDASISMFSWDQEAFPSKIFHYPYLKPCLYDDSDLYDSLRATATHKLEMYRLNN
jgi:hypothetical protein